MQAKKLNFEVKSKLSTLAKSCFWYWDGYFDFLESCGVPKAIVQKYPRAAFNKPTIMRNVLNDLDARGDTTTIMAIVGAFYRMQSPPDSEGIDPVKAKQLLNEFRELVGNDPIENEIERRDRERARQEHNESQLETKQKLEQLSELQQQFMAMVGLANLTPQQRGFNLERLFFDLLELEDFDCTRPYRTASGEQIDGHFKYEKFDYLVESKWEKDVAKQQDLSVFDGKIRGKAQSTRGFFLSAPGFDGNAIQKYSGDAPRLILMDGSDLAFILGGHKSFSDAMKVKVDAIVRHGRIFHSLGS